MRLSQTKKVKNFIDFYGKPFTIDNVTGETGLTHVQARKVVAKLMHLGMVKIIATEGKRRIYLKNKDYVEKNPMNNYGYEIDFIKELTRLIKTGNYHSQRQLEMKIDAERGKISRYLVAMASIGMITIENDFYKFKVEKDYLLVGSKVDKDILLKFREKNRAEREVNMARKEKVLKDASGREYPAKILDPQIVKRDTLVSRVMGRAERLHDKITYEKQKLAADIDKYLQKTAEQYGENWKGNAELVSFDGKYKVEVRNRERIEFDEKLQVAKQKIDECLKRWTEDSNVNLQAVINEAFQVDKKGEIAKHRILALRKYNIKDKNWKQAMDIIDEAIQVTSTKQYIAFYKRKSPNKPFELISLNFSAI